MSYIILYSLTSLVLFYYIYSQRRPKNFPPGPRFPVLMCAYVFLFGIDAFKTAISWKKYYGPIIGAKLFGYRLVIISDYNLAKEAFASSIFAGRPPFKPILERSDGKPAGIIFTEGKQWQEQRQFALRKLRDFGFGTKSMEHIVQDEIQECIDRLKENIGVPITTTNTFNVAVVNALWTIVTGDRFEQDDPELNRIMGMITQNLGRHPTKRLVMFIPILAKYFPELTGYNELLAPDKAAVAFLQPYIDDHFKRHQPGQPRDFIDAYIDNIKNTQDPTSSFHVNNQKSMVCAIIDLFAAGAETTSTTLTWVCLYMARNQHVQDKLAGEIQRIVGNARLPSLSDRPNMPYTEAVIHEVMRAATMLPIAIPHYVTEDTQFQGYNIPKDTTVIINVYEVHNEIELWGDPENFRPERFLTKDELKFVKCEGFLPFSTGKRVCPGEGLARDELFLFTASLFQAFHISIDPNSEPPLLQPTLGVPVARPQPHKLVFSIRS